MADIEKLMDLLSREDPCSSSDLVRALGVSQPTVSRLLKQAGGRVLRMGRGRATRYAALRVAFGHARSIPLFSVDELGRVSQVGTIHALASGRYQVEATASWLLGLSGDGTFSSLPYYLYDLRPAGFLGRRIARLWGPRLGFSSDPRGWTDEQIGQYLVREGTDLPGNLVLGQPAAERVNRAVHRRTSRQRDWPNLAHAVLQGDAPGSSAAGEQPKLALVNEAGEHVIVKFSPTSASPEAERWRDLLPHADLTLLDEAGHFPQEEASKAAIEAVQRFVAEGGLVRRQEGAPAETLCGR